MRFFPFHFLHKIESKARTIAGGQGKKRVRARREIRGVRINWWSFDGRGSMEYYRGDKTHLENKVKKQ